MRKLSSILILTAVLAGALGLPMAWTASQIFLTVDNILAGTNVTLDKTSTTVTINASGGGGSCGAGDGTHSTVCGTSADANGDESVAVGYTAITAAAGDYSTVMGSTAQSNDLGNIVLGYAANAISGVFNSFIAGSDTITVDEVYFGNGERGTGDGSQYTISGSNGGTGSNNKNGGNLRLSGGVGKGTGRGGDIVMLGTYPGAASGTSANTRRTRFYQRSKSLTLSAGSATNVVVFDITDGQMVGAQIYFTVRASDGTNHAARSGIVNVVMVNKGGTISTNASGIGADASVLTGGATWTTMTWDFSTTTTQATVRLTAETSLSETTLDLTYNIMSYTRSNVTAQ
jgi:hypothetical protein